MRLYFFDDVLPFNDGQNISISSVMQVAKKVLSLQVALLCIRIVSFSEIYFFIFLIINIIQKT